MPRLFAEIGALAGIAVYVIAVVVLLARNPSTPLDAQLPRAALPCDPDALRGLSAVAGVVVRSLAPGPATTSRRA